MIVERVAPLFNAHHTFVVCLTRLFISRSLLSLSRSLPLPLNVAAAIFVVAVVVVVIIISRLIFARFDRSRWDYINSDGQLFASISFGRLWYWPCALFSTLANFRLHHHSNLSGERKEKANPKKLSNFEFVLLQPIQWTIIYFVNFVLIVPRASTNSTLQR